MVFTGTCRQALIYTCTIHLVHRWVVPRLMRRTRSKSCIPPVSPGTTALGSSAIREPTVTNTPTGCWSPWARSPPLHRRAPQPAHALLLERRLVLQPGRPLLPERQLVLQPGHRLLLERQHVLRQLHLHLPSPLPRRRLTPRRQRPPLRPPRRQLTRPPRRPLQPAPRPSHRRPLSHQNAHATLAQTAKRN